MFDLLFVGLGVVGFGLTFAYIAACDRM